MMYCPGCGTNNQTGARYCGVCGRELLAGAASGSTAQHPAASVDPAETSAGTMETTTATQPAGMTARMQAAATNAAPVRTAASTTATSASTASDIVATVVSIAMMVAGKASDIAAIVAGVAAGVVTAAAATRPGRMAADIVHEAISLLPGRTGAGITAGTASTATAGAASTATAGVPGTRQPRQRYRIRMPSEARQAELAAKGIPIDYPLRSTWLTGIGVAITLPSAILTSVCKDEITEELFYGSIDMMIGLAIIQCLIIMMLKAYRVRVIPILWASIYVFYTFLLSIFMILQSNVWPLITFLASIAILVGCCLRN